MPAGRIDPPVEQLEVSSLDRLEAALPRGLQPSAGPFHIGAPAAAILALRPSAPQSEPRLRALSGAKKRVGSGPGISPGSAPPLRMGHPDDRAVDELLAEIAVNGAPNRGVAGEVEVDPAVAGKGLDLLVGARTRS